MKTADTMKTFLHNLTHTTKLRCTAEMVREDCRYNQLGNDRNSCKLKATTR